MNEDVSRTYLEEAKLKLRRFFIRRQGAYQRVFSKDSEDVKLILADLAKFCRAHETAFDADPRITALYEGRREVFLRLQHHLQLTTDEFWQLYVRKDIE